MSADPTSLSVKRIDPDARRKIIEDSIKESITRRRSLLQKNSNQFFLTGVKEKVLVIEGIYQEARLYYDELTKIIGQIKRIKGAKYNGQDQRFSNVQSALSSIDRSYKHVKTIYKAAVEMFRPMPVVEELLSVEEMLLQLAPEKAWITAEIFYLLSYSEANLEYIRNQKNAIHKAMALSLEYSHFNSLKTTD